MRFRLLLIFALIALAAGSAYSQSSCTPVSGTYAIGDGTDGNATTGTGPWTLTATNSTFSYVQYFPAVTPTFAQLQTLSATFTSNSGGSGGGSPRISVRVDYNLNGIIDAGDKSFLIYLGNSASFTDTDAVLNTYSGANLIGNNDAGRYYTSAFPGGSPSATYSAGASSALTLAGSYPVLRLSFIEDTFGAFPSRNLTFNGFNFCAQIPDLTIQKTSTTITHGVPGEPVSFSIIVTNSGTAPTSGTVTVVDSAPAGMSVSSISGNRLVVHARLMHPLGRSRARSQLSGDHPHRHEHERQCLHEFGDRVGRRRLEPGEQHGQRGDYRSDRRDVRPHGSHRSPRRHRILRDPQDLISDAHLNRGRCVLRTGLSFLADGPRPAADGGWHPGSA